MSCGIEDNCKKKKRKKEKVPDLFERSTFLTIQLCAKLRGVLSNFQRKKKKKGDLIENERLTGTNDLLVLKI